MDIIVEGIEETIQMLKAAPKNIVKAVYAKALAAAAARVVDALAPREPVKSGDLKAHRVTDIAIDSEGRGGVASVGYGKAGHKANWVEYGHRMIGHKPSKKELGEVAPHPFMRPAAAESAEPAIEAFRDSVNESLTSHAVPGLKTA